MLYALISYLADNVWSALRAFQYVSMRAITSILTALLLSLWIGPRMIQYLKRMQIGQFVRDDGPQSHLAKTGTPTMGGTLIILSISVSTLLWADLTHLNVWIVLGVLIGVGAVGFIDDYRKLIKKQSLGLRAKEKYFYLSIISLVAGLLLYISADSPQETQLLIPYVKDWSISLGVAFIPWAYVVIIGSSNAVNFTDGLDGLAIMPTVMVAGGLAIFSYVAGHYQFSQYLNVPFIKGASEMVIVCAAIFGAGLGFLWFNTYPAQVFMGDVGALALGGALGVIALVVRQELAFAVMAGLFVMEVLSVFIQVVSFKLTGKRVFRMAPIHHHFELKGWPEPRVIVRFWIITVILVLIGLASLKIR